MAAAKTYTKAEEYRRLIAEKQKGETLYDVECECGMVWKARRTSVDFWVSSGILPMHLVETMLTALDKTGGENKPEKLLKTLASKEVIQSIVFSNKVVKHTAVEPRIVETVVEANDISQEETLQCCYHRLLNWAMKGGEEADKLGNFPVAR